MEYYFLWLHGIWRLQTLQKKYIELFFIFVVFFFNSPYLPTRMKSQGKHFIGVFCCLLLKYLPLFYSLNSLSKNLSFDIWPRVQWATSLKQCLSRSPKQWTSLGKITKLTSYNQIRKNQFIRFNLQISLA